MSKLSKLRASLCTWNVDEYIDDFLVFHSFTLMRLRAPACSLCIKKKVFLTI